MLVVLPQIDRSPESNGLERISACGPGGHDHVHAHVHDHEHGC